ncbi:MAG: hypothetical protein ACKVWV_10805 [Planctomycetota bacterium]
MKRSSLALPLFVTASMLAGSAHASAPGQSPSAPRLAGTLALGPAITVDLALSDVSDFGGAQTVADLPGPDGRVSLREAVTAANNTVGPQTIVFAIPLSEWGTIYTDRAIIRLENHVYVSDDETTLDFTTQTSFTGNTNLSGGEVGVMYAGPPAGIPHIWIAADDCTVKGLDVGFGNNFGNTIWITGNHNRVIGCTTTSLTIRGDYGGGAFNVIGGTTIAEGNRFSDSCDILSHANDNVVIGNTFGWGLRISGDTFWGPCERNRIGGPTASERNVIAGKGLYGEEGLPLGVQLEIFHAQDTLVEGNFVGTRKEGMAPAQGRSGVGGIVIGIGANGTTVRGNVVSGIAMDGIDHYQGQRFGTGIAVVASAQSTTIVGNKIGVGADGEFPVPNYQGVVVQSDPNGVPNAVLLGGAAPADANIVAHNEREGVRVANTASGVTISRNSIHDNGTLGIDLVGLSGVGVTGNDPLDGDGGANELQNFPVLSAVQTSSAMGLLSSTPNETFTIELYSSPACDASGFGEGEQFVGATTVTTSASGIAAFSVALATPIAAGSVITATATSASGSTSEFSPCGVVMAMPGIRPIRR